MPNKPETLGSSSKTEWQQQLLVQLLGAAVLAVIGSLFYGWGYQSLARERAAVVAQTEALENFVALRSKIDLQNREAEEKVALRRGRLDDLLARIPELPQETEFLAQLSKLSRLSDFSIRQFTPGPLVQQENHAHVDINVLADASYESLCTFFDGLMRLPRLCQVTDFEVRAVKDETLSYPVQMTLRIYCAPLSAESSNANGGGRA